jgi:aldose 1-epimerase
MNQTEEVLVRADEIELTVLPALGARLHSLKVRGRELLRSPGDLGAHEREPFFWGAYTMAPWCNRITPEPVTVSGRVVDLQPNFEDGTAIHGQVHAAPWERIGDASFAIERAGNGWPWRYRVEIGYAISGRRLAITQRLRNLDDAPMPGGIGWHPWFPTPVELRVNSAMTFGNATALSVDPEPVAGDLDLRQRTPMAVGVDATWAQPEDPAFELWWPDGLHAGVRAPFPTLHVVGAFAPQRAAIAVEPQTNAPQGLQRLLDGQPGALAMIEPGAEMVLPIEMAFDLPS